LPHCKKLPKQAHWDDAGYDVYAAINESVLLSFCEIQKIPLGFKIELPTGFEAQIRPRSGYAKEGITIPNSPGTVDAGYRGEVCVLIHNLGRSIFEIKPGMKIAQMVINQLPHCTLRRARSLSESDRGENGYGSTGIY
jgi:dUTP pyrophosphatase